jgi:hypothetical protein
MCAKRPTNSFYDNHRRRITEEYIRAFSHIKGYVEAKTLTKIIERMV